MLTSWAQPHKDKQLATVEFILEELRSFRASFDEYKEDSIQRLATLETQIKSVEPLKSDVDDLKAWKWKMAGICLGISGFVSTVVLIYQTIKR
jgi:hypothetical protein